MEDARTNSPPTCPPPGTPALCVLGSGSRGNCSVIHPGSPRSTETSKSHCSRTAPITLIDLGLSPRATAARLESVGLSLSQVSTVLITHLDRDHCHEGWCTATPALPPHCELFVPRTHVSLARQYALNAGRLHTFREHFRSRAGVNVSPILLSHDSLGAAAFRVSLRDDCTASLGFATDLGRATDKLINFMHGVSVLAIESNYCPKLQAASQRPDFLKRRIMGGHGHLSNHECLDAIHAIKPAHHVVLLHLSQECNDPHLVASLHEGADYALTISSQDQPTRWVQLHRDNSSLPIQTKSVQLARHQAGA